jgi:predicted dehydrogenase
MTSKPYKAAVIGIGRIGMALEDDPKRLKPATHFGMWDSHPRADFVAVADADPKKLSDAARRRPGIRTYTDPTALLATEKPDIVSIATWKDTHYEMMRLCLDHGIPAIVCEKPIAERYEDAAEIVSEARIKGAHLFINHRRRFDELLYPMRNEIANGFIGEVMQVSSYYCYGLVTTGTHLVDALRFLLLPACGEVEWVAAYPNKLSAYHPPDDPCIDGVVGFANGQKATIQSLNIRDYDLFQFDIFGRAGKFSLRNIGRDIFVHKVISSPEHEGFTELSDAPTEVRGGAPREQFRYMADNVIDTLEGRAQPLSTGEDSLKALQILLAMQESVRGDGRKVIVP